MAVEVDGCIGGPTPRGLVETAFQRVERRRAENVYLHGRYPNQFTPERIRDGPVAYIGLPARAADYQK